MSVHHKEVHYSDEPSLHYKGVRWGGVLRSSEGLEGRSETQVSKSTLVLLMDLSVEEGGVDRTKGPFLPQNSVGLSGFTRVKDRGDTCLRTLDTILSYSGSLPSSILHPRYREKFSFSLLTFMF